MSSTIEKFWNQVDRKNEDECWNWTGSKDRLGYAVFFDSKRSRTASSFALELKIGRQLSEIECCRRTCKNRSCCNPNHLFIGQRRAVKRWTPDELRILETLSPTHSFSCIAKIIGKTRIAVKLMAKKKQIRRSLRRSTTFAEHRYLDKVLNGLYRRCCVESDQAYARYGKRGIGLCDEWNREVVGQWSALINFTAWALSSGYQRGLTLDRKDPNKGYTPDNCRWATTQQQAYTKRKKKTSRFYGVFWDRRRNIWKAEVSYLTKKKFIGTFESEEEAAKKVDAYLIINRIPRLTNFDEQGRQRDLS